jgi:hypothetical protein
MVLAAGLVAGVAPQPLQATQAAAQPPANDQIVLKMRFKSGQTDRYQMNSIGSMTEQFVGQKSALTLPTAQNGFSTWRVDRALPNGGGLVTIGTEIRQSQVAGHTVAPPPGGSFTIAYDSLGEIVSAKGLASGSAPSNPMTSLAAVNGIMSFNLPGRPVRVGDVWEAQARVPGLGLTGVARSRLLNVEQIGKYKCARIRMYTTLPIRLLLGSGRSPGSVNKASKAVAVVTGTETITTDMDFAVEEGKLVRAADAGQFTIHVRPPAGSAAKGAAGRAANMLFKINLSMDLVQ